MSKFDAVRGSLAACLLGAGFLAGFASTVGAETGHAAPAEATSSVDPAVCGACHGNDGNSVNPTWPNLAGQNKSYLKNQLYNFKEGLRENALMSAQAMSLTDADIEKLATYFATQKARVASISASEAAPGEALYRGGDAASGVPACSGCHGPNGAGNAAAGYPSLRGQQVDYTISTLKAYRDGSRQSHPKYANMMNNVAGRMSDAQIEAVARYVSALY